MWSIWLVFCDCGFPLVCPLRDKDKRLMEASWWETLTAGKLGLVLMDGAMFSKSLIQFSVDGWGCVLSQLRSWHLVPSLHGNSGNSVRLYFWGLQNHWRWWLQPWNYTLPTKVRLVKAMVFPVVMYGCASWNIKKAERQRIDTDLGSSSFSILSFCLFMLFIGFSKQEYWSGLPFPSPVDHILSDLSTMTCPSWVGPHCMA